MKIFEVNGVSVRHQTKNNTDYLSLTDLAKYKSDETSKIIENWMRTYNTISYLGTWEIIHNPDFKPLKFEEFKNESGENSFLLSPTKWITSTNAIGLATKAGRYGGGTFAHKDIAFKFASWLSVEFELYVIKEFQRLKQAEQANLQWSARRELTKINYRIHIDAIKETLIIPTLTEKQKSFVYANEADLLNVALFGETASEWKERNPNEKGNMRDYATIHQLLVLANLESNNSEMILDGLSQSERLTKLNAMAKRQMAVLLESNNPLFANE
jgi:hypothetical protein